MDNIWSAVKNTFSYFNIFKIFKSFSKSEPAVIEPAVIEPAVIEPAVIEPAVIEPAVIEPAVIEPAVVEPKTNILYTPMQNYLIHNDPSVMSEWDYLVRLHIR